MSAINAKLCNFFPKMRMAQTHNGQPRFQQIEQILAELQTMSDRGWNFRTQTNNDPAGAQISQKSFWAFCTRQKLSWILL